MNPIYPINKIMSHFKVPAMKMTLKPSESICPWCGSNRIRHIENDFDHIGVYYTVINRECIEDYGVHECENGHRFLVDPEGWDEILKEPYGFKIIKL